MSAVFGWIIFSQGLSLIEIFFLAILIGGILLLQLQEGDGSGEKDHLDQ
jgi:multidrug transporter EmrE-like cation transporter